uniref:Uncharacterized protein n=1 Tax=Micrurus lemniscatus lemniscatus TaxID=129467 RepID=A0A2D4IFQ1_MICLE
MKHNIPFRWLIPEGLLITWQEKKIKIDNLGKAQDFYDELMIVKEKIGSKEESESKSQEEQQSEEKELEQEEINKEEIEQGEGEKNQDKSTKGKQNKEKTKTSI